MSSAYGERPPDFGGDPPPQHDPGAPGYSPAGSWPPAIPGPGYGPMPGYGPAPGYPPPGMPYGYPVPQPGNGLAVAGMVCGIVGLVFFWLPFLGWILAALGIIFGGIGLSRARRGATGKGQAIAGLACGIASLVLFFVVVLALTVTS